MGVMLSVLTFRVPKALLLFPAIKFLKIRKTAFIISVLDKYCFRGAGGRGVEEDKMYILLTRI